MCDQTKLPKPPHSPKKQLPHQTPDWMGGTFSGAQIHLGGWHLLLLGGWHLLLRRRCVGGTYRFPCVGGTYRFPGTILVGGTYCFPYCFPFPTYCFPWVAPIAFPWVAPIAAPCFPWVAPIAPIGTGYCFNFAACANCPDDAGYVFGSPSSKISASDDARFLDFAAGAMHWMAFSLLWMALFLLLFLWTGPAVAQEQVVVGREVPGHIRLELPPPIVTSQTEFEIPFHTDDTTGRLVEVQLYVSSDLGETWHLYARQSPYTPRIPFTSVGDGEYLFALKTLDRDGRLQPTGPPIPTLRLIIDTVRPELSLRVEPDKDGRVAINWRATDQNLDPAAISLSYRMEGVNQPVTWFPLPTGRTVTEDHQADQRVFQDRVTWLPDARAEAIVLRAEIKDQAGNLTTTYQPISLGSLVRRSPDTTVQGSMAGLLPAPNAQAQERIMAARQSLDPVPRPTNLDPASATPIDWPSQSPSNPLAQNPVGPTEGARDAIRAQSTSSQLAQNPVGPSGGTRATMDPFRALMNDPSLRREDLSGQELVVSEGSTLHANLQAPGHYEPHQNAMSMPNTLSPQHSTSPQHPSSTTPMFKPAVNVREPVPLQDQETASAPAAQPTRPITQAGPPLSELPPGTYFRVNTLQFRLRYQVDGMSPSQIGAVSIFGSRNMGAQWQLWATDPDKTSPVEISVPEEGRYAFRVVVSSTTGNTSPIPRPGDQPELIIDIDQSPPEPRLVAVPYGQNPQQATLEIQWECPDQDLGPNPIALAYSHSARGPWTTITAASPNSGRYNWPLQPNLPNEIYLRVTATDLAGNIGTHMLERPINIAPLLPRGRILGIDK